MMCWQLLTLIFKDKKMKKQSNDFAEITTQEELAQVSGGGRMVFTLTKNCDQDSCDTKQDPKSGSGGVDGSL